MLPDNELMKIQVKKPPRQFKTGVHTQSDCGSIHLEAGEQVTFITPSGGECDFSRTDWGFYATPSINDRLSNFGIRAAVIQNKMDKIFVVLVEQEHNARFESYLKDQGSRVLAWLNSDFPDHSQAP